METALGKRLNEDQLGLLGRQLIAQYTSQRAAMDGFRAERDKFKSYSEGNFADRETRDETSIYSKSNIPLEFITGVADFMVARTAEDIFGSDPYFAVIPQGPADETLSKQLPKHFGYKLTEARFKSTGRQAIHRGYHIGEGLVKATWKRDVDISEKLAMVLCSGPNKSGDEVVDENGDYIYPEDSNLKDEALGVSLWAKSAIEVRPEGEFVVVAEIHPLPILVNAQRQPVMTASEEYWFESDVQVVLDRAQAPLGEFLCKSPIVQEQEGWDFQDRLIEETQVLYEGLDDALVSHGDFVAPLNIRHLSESDGTFHRLSLRRSVLREQYGLTPEIEAKIGVDDQTPKNDDKKPQTGEGQAREPAETEQDPEYECIECYSRLDALGDGTRVRIYALVERKSEAVIACDYWANVTPQAIVPFGAIVPYRVPGRWHGRSVHKIFENETDFIDRTFNAIIYRNKMHANAPGFINEEAFKDAAVAKNFVVGAGKIYKLKRDFNAKDVLQFVEFPDLDDRTVEILELVMQMAQVRIGVTGASQGAVTNLPSNGTATGVQSIMSSGSTLHKLPIESVKDGMEDILNINVMILYANQNRDETFAFMEGDATELITLSSKNVKSLRLNIRLLLTRLHEREALESSKAAIEAVVQYLNGIPEPEKDKVRPLFIQVLKALRITGADAILRHAVEVQPPDNQLERFNLSINYKDTPPDIRRQMEADAGYQPSAQGDSVEQGTGSAENEEPPPVPENAVV